MSLSSSTITYSLEDQALRADTLQALDCVYSNYSFASANNDNRKFKAMFPDSKIAESYAQGETKTKYVIEFGIAPYFKKNMLKDFVNQPFTFKFDETTTSQIKKQYDGYVQFWSPNIHQIVNKYCGFLFVGHCTSEQLLHHFDFSKEVTSKYDLRHSSVRWLSLRFVLVHVIKQWENLKEYFCTFLPKQKEFKKSGKETKRYKNIVERLNDEMTLPYLAFVVSLSNEYESYLLTFQSEKPLIHMLFHGMSTLLTNILKHFVNKKSLFVTKDGVSKIKP